MNEYPEVDELTLARELEALWELLDRDGPDEALRALAEVTNRRSAHEVVEAAAWTELAEFGRAREALDRAAHSQTEAIDTDYLWADAELCLQEWRLEEARERFELLQDIEEHPAVHERLALIDDLEDQPARADKHLAAAARLDAEGYPLPPRLDEDEVDALVAQAAQARPAEFARARERIEIRIEPVPSRELAERAPDEVPPDALGLFVGASALDDPSGELPELPPVIYLFQRNLERAATDPEHLREELIVTLYHELAHLLGYDEQGAAALGLE